MKYLTFKNVLLAVAFIIIAILLLRGCGGKGDEAKRLKEESDAAKARYESKIKSLDAELAIKKDSMNTLAGERQAAVLERNRTASLLSQSNSKAVQLANRIKSLTGQDPIVIVEPCDSLADIVINQEGMIKEMENWIDQTDSLMMYEVSIRDEVIVLLQDKFVTCDSNLIAERARFNQLYKTLKPKGQVWLGGEISGSAITPFNQAGVVVSYVPKKGSKMYSVGGGLQVQGGYYIKIGAQFKLSFRK